MIWNIIPKTDLIYIFRHWFLS